MVYAAPSPHNLSILVFPVTRSHCGSFPLQSDRCPIHMEKLLLADHTDSRPFHLPKLSPTAELTFLFPNPQPPCSRVEKILPDMTFVRSERGSRLV